MAWAWACRHGGWVLPVGFSVDFRLGLGLCQLGLIGFCWLGLGSQFGFGHAAKERESRPGGGGAVPIGC